MARQCESGIGSRIGSGTALAASGTANTTTSTAGVSVREGREASTPIRTGIALAATGGTAITITEVDTLADTRMATTTTDTGGRRGTRPAARTGIRTATPPVTTVVAEARLSASSSVSSEGRRGNEEISGNYLFGLLGRMAVPRLHRFAWQIAEVAVCGCV